MDDFISRQEAIEALESKTYRHTYLDQIVGIIKDLPSAQSEIIRCKDCKHYKFSYCYAFGRPEKYCEWFGFKDFDYEDFCSRAERREA